MRIVVADASSLILLAKCSLLRTYCERVEVLTPRRVLEEAADRDLWEKHPDAEQIAACAEEGLIRAETVDSDRRLPVQLGAGEADAIRLFLEAEADVLLSDDGRALRACRLLSVPFTTSPRVVVDLRKAGAVELQAARQALEKLAVVGRYAREIIAAALTALHEQEDSGGSR